MLKLTIFLFLFFLSFEIYSQSNLDVSGDEVYQLSSNKSEVWDADISQTRYITGELFKERVKSNGKVVKEIKYYKNGRIKSYEAYSPGSYFEVDSAACWYENGNIKEIGKTIDGKFKVISFWDSTGTLLVKEGSGKMISYFNGLLDFKGEYKNGLKEGNWYYGHYSNESYEQGNYIEGKKEGNWIAAKYESTLIWTEIYSHDKLIKGKRVLNTGDTVVYFQFATEPTYPGGMSEFAIDVRELMGKIFDNSTKIIVSLTIDKNGNIENPEVVKGKGTELEKRLIEALKYIKPWLPAMLRGCPVKRRIIIPFRF